jgi:hypothetical protein
VEVPSREQDLLYIPGHQHGGNLLFVDLMGYRDNCIEMVSLLRYTITCGHGMHEGSRSRSGTGSRSCPRK